MASKVKDENYCLIQGWMLTKLQLKSNDLLVYAIIYGFSQTEGQVFNGSLQYLVDWTNASRQTVINSLKSLVSKGYIAKNEKTINGVKFCEYYATELDGGSKNLTGVVKKLDGGSQKIRPNNIENNIEDNLDIKKERKKKTTTTSYDEIINRAVENPELKDAIREFIKMRKLAKKPMTDRALEMLITKLQKLTDDVGEQIEIINQSTINNWSSVYPPKDSPARKAKQDEIRRKREEEVGKQWWANM
ncbi:helix-turn-helix domain-containing protein [Megamonas hypermegale]|uniref:helix-turn-helix domain-containing protein n=1 Tax=Megamonas hypermegale TaxID=158847 RepID=UPI0026F347BD|nr:helix-turn-helix domain-containing protein [Megamonas hypermegale]